VRNKVTHILLEYIQNNKIQLRSLAVVGGSSNDPEVVEIKKIFPQISISYYGIDNPDNDFPFTILDLNEPVQMNISFDLVLCSQVLEHLWNVQQAFKSLADMAGKSGLVWINCPASNMAHGSPAYFSAGYSSDYLEKNLVSLGQEVILHGNIGSKRYYFMTHTLRFWATELEHRHPVLGYRTQPGTFLGITKKLILELPPRIFAVFFSRRVLNTIDFSTESYSLSRTKVESRP